MIAAVRTTVTIDPDVERLVREAMHRTRKSFKETINAAIRAGLSGRPRALTGKPFKLKARPMHLRAGLDPGGLNKLADELEVEAFLAKARKAKAA